MDKETCISKHMNRNLTSVERCILAASAKEFLF
jgi:hypothetical protein